MTVQINEHTLLAAMYMYTMHEWVHDGKQQICN